MESKLENVTNLLFKGADFAFEKYNRAYEISPNLTSYSTSIAAVMGGDYMSKTILESSSYDLKDAAFTFAAALVYNYLAPKMLAWSKKITNNLKKSGAVQKLKSKKLGKQVRQWSDKKKDELTHWTATGVLLGMYYPLNFAYWNALSVKNSLEINQENTIEGLGFTALMLLPYVPVDYFAIKKLSSKQTEKYIRPFYAGVEIIWNTIFAGGSYVAKKT